MHDGDEGCVGVVEFGLFGEEDFDRVSLASDCEDGTADEVLRKNFGIAFADMTMSFRSGRHLRDSKGILVYNAGGLERKKRTFRETKQNLGSDSLRGATFASEDAQVAISRRSRIISASDLIRRWEVRGAG